MHRLWVLFFLFIALFSPPQQGICHGLNADMVDIVRLLKNGRYRIIIKYTNLQIGEYREAYLDFTSKKDAIDAFQKLVRGADFFLGDSASIHFHKEGEKISPY